MNNIITLKKERVGVVIPWSQIADKHPFVAPNGHIYVKSTGGSRFNFFTNEVDYPRESDKVSVLRYVSLDITEI